jgi:DNA-binding NtrC family response regulator
VSTILFVDDHHALRTVFAETLRSAGHVVLEAGAMADAERLVERQSGAIDLLIVEAVLTTTNGLEVFQRFQPVFPKMNALFISEESGESLHEQGLLPKGAYFLRKPFGAEDLIGIVQRLANAGKPQEAGKRTSGATSRRAGHKPLRAGARRNS